MAVVVGHLLYANRNTADLESVSSDEVQVYNCAMIPAHHAAERNMIDSIQRGEIGILYLHAALFAIVEASMWLLLPLRGRRGD